jgi:hypothetical protein
MAQTVTCERCGEDAATRADGTAREPLQHKWGPTLHRFTVAAKRPQSWRDRAAAGSLVVKEYTR